MKSLKSPAPAPGRRPKRRAVATNATGRKLMAVLDEIIQAERAGGAGLTVREVEVPDPNEYAPADVRALRDTLGISVALFARLTGVTAAQVEHWEQGRRTPSPMARRLFDRIAADPQSSLAELIVRREQAAVR
jgi:DNA-binding transcriptional regulator YiaG